MDLKKMMDYLAALEAHNDRSWFHENHKWYDEARASFNELLETLRFDISAAAPDLADDIMYCNVKDWTYRIARDMRYHKGSAPYNPSFRAYISPDKKSWEPVGYFLRLQPGRSIFGTALWCEDSGKLNAVRSSILRSWEELMEIEMESGIEIGGEKLKKAPKGFDENHPGVEWIKFKNWEMLVAIPDDVAYDDGKLEDFISDAVRRMEPFRKYMLRTSRESVTEKQILEEFYNI